MESNPLTLVQINFRYCPLDQDAAQKAAWERAHAIAQVPGLHWKLWIFNPDTQDAGGIYLFNDEASANDYLNGPIVESIKQMAGVEHLEAKLFSINSMLSQLTHAQLPK